MQILSLTQNVINIQKMARQITIKNSKWFKKQLTQELLTDGTSYCFVQLDGHGRATDDDSEAELQVIFDSQCIGRGVQIEIEEDMSSVNLVLPLPPTEADVHVFYTLARRIASAWGANTVMLDDEKVELSKLGEYEELLAETKTSLLEDDTDVEDDATVVLLCATLPICFCAKQLADLTNDNKAFAKYLHERQSIYPFYSIAWFMGDETETVSKYVAIPDGAFVLPNTPEMTYYGEDGNVECARALIAVPNLFEGGEIAEIDFVDFLSNVPDDHKCEFDSEHTLILPLSISELQEIFKGV